MNLRILPAQPHGPLREVFPGIHLVKGTMRMGAATLSRNMTVVRRGDDLVLVNSVRLDDQGLAELERLGKVTDVIRLAGGHGSDDPFYVWPTGAEAVHVRHGVRDGLDVHAGISPVSLAFGAPWVDLGASVRLHDGDGLLPYVLATVATNVATNGDDWMLFHQLTLVASWRLHRWIPYVGWDSALQVVPGWRYAGIPSTGLRLRLGAFEVFCETRWYVPWAPTEESKLPYVSIGGRGALGLAAGVGLTF